MQERFPPIYLSLKVTPNGQKNEVLGWEGEVLWVRIRGVPQKGEVNRELVSFFADLLDLPKSCLELDLGHTSRLKRLKIVGMSERELRERLPQRRRGELGNDFDEL